MMCVARCLMHAAKEKLDEYFVRISRKTKKWDQFEKPLKNWEMTIPGVCKIWPEVRIRPDGALCLGYWVIFQYS